MFSSLKFLWHEGPSLSDTPQVLRDSMFFNLNGTFKVFLGQLCQKYRCLPFVNLHLFLDFSAAKRFLQGKQSKRTKNSTKKDQMKLKCFFPMLFLQASKQ